MSTRRPFRSMPTTDRKSTRLNSSHLVISYAVFCLKKNNSHARNSHPLSRRAPSPATTRPQRAAQAAEGAPDEGLGADEPPKTSATCFFFFKSPGAPPNFPLFPTAPLS